MAGKARKDRAKSNADALKNLHIGTFTINSLFVLANLFYRRRSLLLYVLLTAPSFVCQYVLESTGRPKYDPETRALRSSGEDLGASGLTEYMFDVIWITWASLVLVILAGNWGWLLWAVVPAYGAVKGYSLLGMARGMASGMQQQQQPEGGTAGMNRKQRRAAA